MQLHPAPWLALVVIACTGDGALKELDLIDTDVVEGDADTDADTDADAEDCADGIDNDGDGQVDCFDPECTSTCDADGDGSRSPAFGGQDCDDNDASLNRQDADGDGVDTCDGDCDDADAGAYPGAPETCNDNVDQDCDGIDSLVCDTAVFLGFVGTALIDAVLDTWTGTETWEYHGSSGYAFCDFEFTALDWVQDPAQVGQDPYTALCVDADSNLCAFSYTVNLSNGQIAAGPNCGDFGWMAGDPGGFYGYGYIQDYRYAGSSFGPTFMYYIDYPGYYIWLGLNIYANFNGVNGQFDYAFDVIDYGPAP